MLKSSESVVGAHLTFPLVHVAMVHQFLPSYEGMSTRMQKSLFLRTSAPQIDSLKAQEMSAMNFHLIFSLPDILHHIWHPKSVSLANTNMRHHLCIVGLENRHQLVLQLHESRV